MLNNQIINNEIDTVMKNLQSKKSLGSDGLITKLYNNFKDGMSPKLHKCFKKIKR